MRERLRQRKAEQERRAQQAARRAEEILSVSSSKMRKAERGPREAVYWAEMLKWRIEGSSLRPRRPRTSVNKGKIKGRGVMPQPFALRARPAKLLCALPSHREGPHLLL